jgi:hypothetical protein
MELNEIIAGLEKVSMNLNYILLDDAFDATEEERKTEITETQLRLSDCIAALKVLNITPNNIQINEQAKKDCPLCHGFGSYTIGGSFGGPTQTIICSCVNK